MGSERLASMPCCSTSTASSPTASRGGTTSGSRSRARTARTWTRRRPGLGDGRQLGRVGGDDAPPPPTSPHLSAADDRGAIVDGVVERYRTLPSPVIAGAPERGPPDRRDAARGDRLVVAPAVIAAAVDGARHPRRLRRPSSRRTRSPSGKPAPDVYLRAASLPRRVAATRCLVVEDSLNGVRAGKAAGAFVVLVPNASVPPAGDARERADLVARPPRDLDPDTIPA